MTLSPKTDAALNLIAASGARGMTWQELGAATGGHHGSSSAMLTKLHKAGMVARLADKRGTSSAYVLPEHVGDRATVAGRVKAARAAGGDHTGGLESLEVTAAWLETLEAAAALERTALEYELQGLQGQIEALEADMVTERVTWLAEANNDRRTWQRVAEAARDEAAEATRLGNDARDRYTARLAEVNDSAARDMDKRVVRARREARDEGEAVGWQVGYDEGVKRGREGGGGDTYAEGRDVGRGEGEDAMRRHVIKVAGELHRSIAENAPIQAHFKGCYKVHPLCAVRAVLMSVGADPRSGRGFPMSKVG